MAERKFDPDEIARFRDFLIDQLDALEADGGPIDSMKKGRLYKAPAFGFTAEGESATTKYAAAHQTSWENLQNLRRSLFGMIQGLNKALEGHELSEDYNVEEFQSYEAEL